MKSSFLYKYKKYEMKNELLGGIRRIRQTINNSKNILNNDNSIIPSDFMCCIENIGNGSFGTVVKGIDKKTGKMIIIKKIDLDSKNIRRRLLSKDNQSNTNEELDTDTLGLRNMFKTSPISQNEFILQKINREISIMKKLLHQNIIRYIGSAQKNKNENENENNIDIDIDDNDILKNKELEIYMEDICGKSLSNIAKSLNGLSLKLLLIYLPQVLNGLNFMHSKNIIHMDIKGDNLLLSNEGIIKIIDFGESIEVVNNNNRKIKIPYGGSIMFIPPELFNKREIEIDFNYFGKTDIWSFGITLIELFVGNLYFPQNRNEKSFDEIIKILIKNLLAKVNKIIDNQFYEIINEDDYLNSNTSTINGIIADFLDEIIHNEEKKANYLDILLFLDLIKSCLQINYKERKSVEELLLHPFFEINKDQFIFEMFVNDLIQIPDFFQNFIN